MRSAVQKILTAWYSNILSVFALHEAFRFWQIETKVTNFIPHL